VQAEQAARVHKAKDKGVKGEDLKTTKAKDLHREQQSSGDEVFFPTGKERKFGRQPLTKPLRTTSYNWCRSHLDMEKMLQTP
jgi:hypothetical protein